MAKTKKWSEQVLVEKSFKTQDENGNEVITKANVLDVCISGLELYKKEFKEGKYKGKNKLIVPYDFLVLAGDFCPKGEFYEVEYQIVGSGNVYRALIQCWNAVTDVRLVLGCLKRNNILPRGFKALRAWKRDIDKVMIAHCSKDEEGAIINGSFYEPRLSKTEDGKEEKLSIYDYGVRYDSHHEGFADDHTCLEYYRGDVHEVWAGPADKDLIDPIFVCGSENVNDPCFADKREADMEEMMDHISEAIAIANDYRLGTFFLVELGADDEGKLNYSLNYNLSKEVLHKMIDALPDNAPNE